MDPVFLILAILTTASATAAVTMRNLVHCALCLVVAFVSLAVLFLQLHAQFIGFAQILVYVGAVAILIVFAILLTRGTNNPHEPRFSSSWLVGLGVGTVVLGALVFSIASSSVFFRSIPPAPQTTVLDLGSELMTNFVLPLEVIGLLLTAALIGAVIIALPEKIVRPEADGFPSPQTIQPVAPSESDVQLGTPQSALRTHE